MTGGLGWTPETFWRRARLDETIAGFACFLLLHRPDLIRRKASLPERNFLARMLAQFPDTRTP